MRNIYTPLRYPGGKASLGRFMRQIFVDNKLLDGCYVEPYAGGAGIALELLLTDYARYIWLNDIDKAIYAFWYSILNHTNEFLLKIKNVPLTIEEWLKQKNLYENAESNDLLSLGFATFFLNRTNRSGILTAGPIGGISQSGNWQIDARFNREKLCKRIWRISQYKHRINLSNEDAETFLKNLDLTNKSLVYLDPPYFHKGQRLYRNHYLPSDHERISRLVQKDLPYYWIVSYDNTSEISDFYKERRQTNFSLSYSVQTKRLGNELLIFCDELFLN